MFTLEIGAAAIAVTNATEEEAKELFESDEFKDDIRAMTREGAPLWDGKALFTIRAAKEDEIDSFDEAMEDDDYEDDAPEDDEEPIDLVFLVEIDDIDEEPSRAS